MTAPTHILPQHAEAMTTLVIDDHPLFCDALSMTLRAIAPIKTIETAETLTAALSRISSGLQPDVVFLDLNLPDVNGLDGLMRLLTAAPGVPVIVVSAMAEPRIVASTLRAGARGFIPKHSKRDIFRAAITAIREGRTYVPDDIYLPEADDNTSTFQEAALSRLSTLTAQQARILGLICEGLLNKQIAFELSIAEPTVKAHVTAIMRKLGVQSRTQAVLIAQEARFTTILGGDQPAA